VGCGQRQQGRHVHEATAGRHAGETFASGQGRLTTSRSYGCPGTAPAAPREATGSDKTPDSRGRGCHARPAQTHTVGRYDHVAPETQATPRAAIGSGTCRIYLSWGHRDAHQRGMLSTRGSGEGAPPPPTVGTHGGARGRPSCRGCPADHGPSHGEADTHLRGLVRCVLRR
jgi:hypothetical protein